MSELEQYTPTNTLAEQIDYAKTVAVSSLLPQAYRQHPENVLVAIGLGQAMGLSPVESLYRIDVIQGKPTASAELIAANVRKAGHKLRLRVDEQNVSATCVIIRADDPDYEHTVTRDKAWAQQMGLLNKDNYKKQPATMLGWRAITACARQACPEALYGVVYTSDEMSDLRPSGTAEVIRSSPASQKDRVRAAIGTGPAEDATPADEPPAESITEAQSKKLHALVNELGLSREQKIGGVSQIVGRPIESTGDLTKAEAVAVIDSLEAKAAQSKPAETAKADEDGAYPADVADTPTDTGEDKTQVWQQVVAAGGNLDMDLWALEADFEQFTGIKVHEGDASAYRAYLTELQGREAA